MEIFQNILKIVAQNPADIQNGWLAARGNGREIQKGNRDRYVKSPGWVGGNGSRLRNRMFCFCLLFVFESFRFIKSID